MIKNPLIYSGGLSVRPTGYLRIRYWDDDGTLLKFQYLASGAYPSPPAEPTHPNKTFLEWNGDLNTAITRDTDFGAIYRTTDGKTYIYMSLNAATGLRPIITFVNIANGTTTINWGDGSPEQSWTGLGTQTITKTLAYLVEGDYIVTITSNVTFSLGYSVGNFLTQNYADSVTKIELGVSCVNIFCLSTSSLKSLESISLHNEITGGLGFRLQNAYSLEHINLPSTITIIEANTFKDCNNLNRCCQHNVVTINNYAFYGCFSLEEFYTNDDVTTFGDNDADGQVFAYCSCLAELRIPPSLTQLSNATFFGGGVSPFQRAPLKHIDLPVSCNIIGAYAMYNMFSLASLTIRYTGGVITVASTAIQGFNKKCKIYVPSTLVAAYKIAPNWVLYTNQIYEI